MKYLTLLCLISLVSGTPSRVEQSPKAPTVPQETTTAEYSKAVKKFIKRCIEETPQGCVDAEAWLKKQPPSKDRDQMFDILSGLVWNFDKVRARKLLRGISDPQKRASIEAYYDALEKAKPPQEKK